jgi:hypothetical protein
VPASARRIFSGAFGRRGNAEYAGGSLNRAVNPGRFYLWRYLFRVAQIRTRDQFNLFYRTLSLLRLRHEFFPAFEREYFPALAKACEIQTAILTSPFVCPERHFHPHPKRRIGVGLACPSVQIWPATHRTPRIKQAFPIDKRRHEPSLAIQATQLCLHAEGEKIFRGLSGP